MKQKLSCLIAVHTPALAERIHEQLGDLTVETCEIHDAYALLSAHQPDIAFLENGTDDALTLSVLREIYDQHLPTAAVLVSDTPEIAWQALEWNAADVIPSDFTPERFAQALRRAKRLTGNRVRTVFIRTFGYFDVFVAGEPLAFTNAKAKELLAVLINEEGSTVNMDVAIDRLWPNRPYDDNVKQLYRKAVNYLNKLFESEKLTFFTSGRGWCKILREGINCDLYDVLENKPHAIDLYDGRYMFAYEWGEERQASLDLLKEKNQGWQG